MKVVRYLQEKGRCKYDSFRFCGKMREYLGESARSAYSNRYMKAKIAEYFAENIIITTINGKPKCGNI